MAVPPEPIEYQLIGLTEASSSDLPKTVVSVTCYLGLTKNKVA